MDSDDVFVLKGEIKRKMQQLAETKIELEKFKASFGAKMAKIMSDKMSIQFDLDNTLAENAVLKKKLNDADLVSSSDVDELKVQLAKSGETLRERSEQIKKLIESIENKDKLIKNIEKEQQKVIGLKDEKIGAIEKELRDLLVEIGLSKQEAALSKSRIKELEQRLVESQHDEKGNTITSLIRQLEENEKQRYDLTQEKKAVEEKMRDILDARSDINKVITESKEKLDKQRHELLVEKESLRIELENDLDKLKITNDRLENELKTLKAKQPEGVVFGEEAAMQAIKEILASTRRNAVIFLPTLDLAPTYDLKLTEIPTTLNVRIGTDVITMDDKYLDEMRDYPHVAMRRYRKRDIMAIVSDNAVLFIAFLTKGLPPSGIKTSNEVAIEFIGTLLRQSLSKSKAFF